MYSSTRKQEGEVTRRPMDLWTNNKKGRRADKAKGKTVGKLKP